MKILFPTCLLLAIAAYQGESTQDSIHYRPQGDRGSGAPYVPSAMPQELRHRHPLP